MVRSPHPGKVLVKPRASGEYFLCALQSTVQSEQMWAWVPCQTRKAEEHTGDLVVVSVSYTALNSSAALKGYLCKINRASVLTEAVVINPKRLWESSLVFVTSPSEEVPRLLSVCSPAAALQCLPACASFSLFMTLCCIS